MRYHYNLFLVQRDQLSHEVIHFQFLLEREQLSGNK